VSYDSGGQDTYSVAVADVNKDSKPDLVVANACASSTDCQNGTVDVLLGNGDGTFQSAVSYGSGGYHAVSVAVADVRLLRSLHQGNKRWTTIDLSRHHSCQRFPENDSEQPLLVETSEIRVEWFGLADRGLMSRKSLSE
jgi:FG-GAP-like repeat